MKYVATLIGGVIGIGLVVLLFRIEDWFTWRRRRREVKDMFDGYAKQLNEPYD